MAKSIRVAGEDIELDEFMIEGSLNLMALLSGNNTLFEATMRKSEYYRRMIAQVETNLRPEPAEPAPEAPAWTRELIGICSIPIQKKITSSDVKQGLCRLLLPKEPVKKILQSMPLNPNENITKGINVVVYGPDGREYAMIFRLWTDKFYVLKSKNWNAFCLYYGIGTSSTLTVRMFRHRQTNDLCFAITW
ncbi:hypothetical protein F511_37601 [Dorcoceras hygrometricum]|uniref:TF-B3 domain-containing protein n=1 Tax=Dorcoceras hygrometricum TaxID=472368 RepID=A0A2Z7CAP2_9LAMI|nr:hypothetical protein F511_37601 [Dorcoceras hygrometricum]